MVNVVFKGLYAFPDSVQHIMSSLLLYGKANLEVYTAILLTVVLFGLESFVKGRNMD